MVALTPAAAARTIPHGGGWGLVALAVFKTVVGREERPGCVRSARASAILDHLGKRGLRHQIADAEAA